VTDVADVAYLVGGGVESAIDLGRVRKPGMPVWGCIPPPPELALPAPYPCSNWMGGIPSQKLRNTLTLAVPQLKCFLAWLVPTIRWQAVEKRFRSFRGRQSHPIVRQGGFPRELDRLLVPMVFPFPKKFPRPLISE
jgi:hypothetical protein